MFKNALKILLANVVIMIVLQACDFNTAKKIQDPTTKYNKAIEYYEIDKYAKAQVLLEDVILSLRMTKEGEKALFTFADCYYHMKDYILAGYYFRKYVEDYPKGINAEEAQFMSAKCYFLDAPKYKLDQQATNIALQEFELFITKYPNSDKITECNGYVDELRDKLEIKAYESAKLYYDRGYYNAAAITFTNNITEFPDTKFKEEIYYYLFMSKYHYAKNSISEKQLERYRDALNAYEKLIEKYPGSKYVNEVKNFHKITKNEIAKLENGQNQAQDIL
jgi:outer membrane protein assembly factor BamD